MSFERVILDSMNEKFTPRVSVISNERLDEQRPAIEILKELETLSGDELILAREKAERARRKGDIPDTFSLSETDKAEVAERLSKVSDEKLKEIDDFFIPFSYDPTRSAAALVNERKGEKNPQWVIDMTDIIYRELLKRGLTTPLP